MISSKKITALFTKQYILNIGMICVLSLAVTACTTKDKLDIDPETGEPIISETLAESIKQDPVEKMYNDAARALDKGSYFQAAKMFDDVDREYPYSQWAGRAQLMSGYSHYKNLKYDEALISLNRFIDLHPSDENAAYAYYLRALCYYEQISDVRRDQNMTQLALENLRQVVERFPESRYARDANLKIDLTMDHLAGKEMEIGRYYLDRKKYEAAINRFKRVITLYQTTTHVPEALHRIVESYLLLGVPEEARKNAAILGHNYPNSEWYKESYALLGTDAPRDAPNPAAKKESTFDRTFGRLF